MSVTNQACGGGRQVAVQSLEFSTDEGAGARARIGLLVLESDQTLEWEMRDLTHLPGVALYHTRVANDLSVSKETLGSMENVLPAAATLIPRYLGLDALGYGCTSAATVIGERRVAEIMTNAHPGVPCSNPLTAAKAALKILGVRKLALLTPYPAEVTEAMQASFVAAGIAVTAVGSFDQESDLVVGKIDSASIARAAFAVGETTACDGVFISCTSLRAANIIPELELALDKPVTSSNHALAWHLLRLAGVDDKLPAAGRLFQH